MRAMSVATLILLRAAAAGAQTDAPASEPQQPDVARTAPGRPQDAANEAAPQTPVPASAPGPGELPETPQIQWQLAPIVYGGDLGYEMRMTRNEGQPATLEQIVLANIRGRSYVWQPWFAQVRGGLGLVLSREHIANDGTNNVGLVDQKPVTVTGNLGLTVFPVSRFPFDASFERTDSRTSGAIASSDYTSTLMSLRQSYSSLDGNTHLSARFERSILESESFGRDTLNNIEANLAQAVGNHNLEFETGYSQNVHEQTDERSTIERASLRDTYRPSNLLTVESLAYVNSTDFDSGSGTTPSSNSRTSQVTSFATWRPAEQSPLYMTGSLRLLSLDTDTTGTPAHSQSLNGTVGANYQYTQYTRLFATAGFTENRSAERAPTRSTRAWARRTPRRSSRWANTCTAGPHR